MSEFASRDLNAWSQLYLAVLTAQFKHAISELYDWIKLIMLVDQDTEFCYPDLPCDTIIPVTQKITVDMITNNSHTKNTIDSPPIHVIVPQNMDTTKYPMINICVVAIRDDRPPCWFWMRVKHKEFIEQEPIPETDLKVVYAETGTYIEGVNHAEASRVIEWIKDVS